MRATFLLPDAGVFGAQRLAGSTAKRLAQADGPGQHAAGRRAQLRRAFPWIGEQWPLAALSRQAEHGDAGGATWLRADPVELRPDINGVRLVAHGHSLGLDEAAAQALHAVVAPAFEAAGLVLDVSSPSRWYARLPDGLAPPATSDPDEAMGEDLFEHMDAGGTARHWRALFNEIQVRLHQDAAEAVARGARPPRANALWFWGGGSLPPAAPPPDASTLRIHGRDASLHAVARTRVAELPPGYLPAPGDALYDLAATRDLAWLESAWLQPAIRSLDEGALDALVIDTAAGRRLTLRRRHRWRAWRMAAGRGAP